MKEFMEAIKKGEIDTARQLLIKEQCTSLNLRRDDLHKLSESQWKSFFKGLSGTAVTSLDLRDNDLHKLSESQWQSFFKGLSGTAVTSLDLRDNDLDKLSESQWQSFFKGLSGTAVTSLDLSRNGLYELTESQWQSVFKGLSGSAVTSLDLGGNYLYKLSESQWQNLFKGLSGTAVTSLDLSLNDFCGLSESQWQNLFKGLSGSAVTSLNLGRNGLNKLSESQWQNLFKGLSGTAVISLDLSRNYLYKLSESQWQNLFKGLSGSAVTSLALGLNFLSESQWQSVFKGLAGSTVTSLNLWGNVLYELSESQWQNFFKELSGTAVTSLNLWGNDLHKFSESQWQSFFKGLSGTAVTSLNLRYNGLDKLSESQWQSFFKGLSGTAVTSLNLRDNGLDKLSESQWQSFFKGFSGTVVTSLNLYRNGLDKLSENQWQSVFKGLSGTAVTSLDLSGNDLGTLSENQWQSVCKDLSGTLVKTVALDANAFIGWSDEQLQCLLAGLKETAIGLDLTGPKVSDMWFDITGSKVSDMWLDITGSKVNDGLLIKAIDRLSPLLQATQAGLELGPMQSLKRLFSLCNQVKIPVLPLYRLDLSHCQLEDKALEELFPLLQKRLNSLRVLDLSHNHLTYTGMQALFKFLEEGKLPKLEQLVLAHNYLECYSIKQLQTLTLPLFKAKTLKAVQVEGNCLISPPKNPLFLKLLQCLLNKTDLTLEAFIQSRFSGLTRISPNEFALTLSTLDKKTITLALDSGDLALYNQMKTLEGIITEEDVVHYVTVELNKRRLEMPPELLACQVKSLSEVEQLKVVDRLLDYHPQSPLSSQLITHPILRSPCIARTSSLWFPKQWLTAQQGYVYLIVNKETQHTRLSYEYITAYGQRCMKMAHLTVQGGKKLGLFANNGTIVIDFDGESSVLETLTKYRKQYLIAGIPAETVKLEKLHEKIEEERLKGVEAKYKWFITASSQQDTPDNQEKKVQNCLKWATDHITKELGIGLKIGVYNPIGLVTALIKNPQTVLVQAQATHGLLQEDTSASSQTCLVM